MRESSGWERDIWIR